MLSEHQPDIQEHGRLFSYAVIFMANVLVIGLWMVLIGAPKLSTFGNLLGSEISTVYAYTWHYILIAHAKVMHLVQLITSGEPA
jgi:hypothetical protein